MYVLIIIYSEPVLFQCALEEAQHQWQLKKYLHPGALLFQWPGNIWLTVDLQCCKVGPAGGKRWLGSTLCTRSSSEATEMSHGRVSWAGWGTGEGDSLLKGITLQLSTSLQSSKLNWPQKYICSPVHALHGYFHDLKLLYNMFSSTLRRVHVLHVLPWVFPRYSSFLPQSSNIQLTGEVNWVKMSTSRCECEHGLLSTFVCLHMSAQWQMGSAPEPVDGWVCTFQDKHRDVQIKVCLLTLMSFSGRL